MSAYTLNQGPGINRTSGPVLPKESKPHHWTASDVETMPRAAFIIWWNTSVVLALRAGRVTCKPPNSKGGKWTAALVRVATERAETMGMVIPAVLDVETKTIAVNRGKLAAAVRRKIGARTLDMASTEIGMRRSSLAAIVLAYHKHLSPDTLGTVCAWLGRKPVEFEL